MSRLGAARGALNDERFSARDGWNEGDHPRDDDGEFTEGGAKRNVGPHGPIFHEHSGKPAEAIEKLMKAQTGEVPGAFKHPYLGDIDIVWGKPGNPADDFKGGYGLSHIIAKHVKSKRDLKIEDLPEAILSAHPTGLTQGNRLMLESKTHSALIGLDWQGKSKKWVLTAYERT